ncbi:hypothetical protein RUM43_003553 [Polyplax serrata]|uniref:C2H2-type domain-containing protein n=1 Tax=Polyplax serrata TaxID=468196 RepID=A0AAN8S394_POLSC
MSSTGRKTNDCIFSPNRNKVTAENENISVSTKSRKLHKSYIKNWTDDLKLTGVAHCIIASCNFIALKLKSIEEHHRHCNGCPCFDTYFCNMCKNYLGNEVEFNDHSSTCTGDNRLQSVNNLQKNDQRKQISLPIDSDKGCEINVKKQSENNKFLTSGKEDKNLHINKIRRLKDELKEDCIIQPGPNLSDGEYRRRRSYTRQHKNTWISTLEKLKYVKCIYQNCYFIAMSLEDMIYHFGYCNGDGSFAKFECSYCHGRVTSEQILKKHIDRSHSSVGNINCAEPQSDVNLNGLNQNKDVPNQSTHVDDTCNIGTHKLTPRLKRSSSEMEVNRSDKYNSRKRKLIHDTSEAGSTGYSVPVESNGSCSKIPPTNVDESFGEIKIPKKRGRKPKENRTATEPDVMEVPKKDPVPSLERSNALIECAKCDFKGTDGAFKDHNLRKHVGLSWAQGDTPVDMNDEKEVIRLVKMAFKLTKKATCEICRNVKRSFMGFVTHIQSCGKSEEEKEALKVQCPHCSAKCLKYSMPVHIKLSHSSSSAAEDDKFWKIKDSERGDSPVLAGKRKSALKAATKFQDFLSEVEEQETTYVLYQKNVDSKLPKVPHKLHNLWYKLKRENKEIECNHSGCNYVTSVVKEARRHYYNCGMLPEKVYMCEFCEFYTAHETEIKTHVAIHKPKIPRKRKVPEVDVSSGGENYEDGDTEVDDGSDSDDDDDNDEEEFNSDEEEESKTKGRAKKRRKKPNEKTKTETDYELVLKRNFCSRENIDNNKRFPYFCSSLKMTLQEEWSEKEDLSEWKEFDTSHSEWAHLNLEPESDLLPPLHESISISIEGDVKGSERKWRRMRRFEGDVLEGTSTMFTGGNVRSLSWCRISFRRMVEKRLQQYLALVTAMDLRIHRNIHSKTETSNRSLIQIWNCGILEANEPQQIPKFCLGICEKSEIWDLSWFREDTSTLGEDGKLARLGLLATASEDGAVRVWSICDPQCLENKNGLPIYETTPVAKLITDEDLTDNCLKVAVGSNGLLAGGYGNGIVALWNLKNIKSPFNEKEGKCFVIRSHLTIQAHRTAITALTFCPNNSRYISSAAMDRLVKIWDLESTAHPVDVQYKDLCLNSIWCRNWPLLFYNFDDFQSNKNRGVGKFVRDIFYERPLACLTSDSMCLSLSFSDWFNALCGSNTVGDVQVRYFRNLISDQKRDKTNNPMSCCYLERLNDKHEKDKDQRATPFTYEEYSSDYGLVFSTSSSDDKTKVKGKGKSEIRPDDYPIRAVNVVLFNPNFTSFTHVAAGYSNGLVRIPRLREVQSNENLKTFLNRAISKSF